MTKIALPSWSQHVTTRESAHAAAGLAYRAAWELVANGSTCVISVTEGEEEKSIKQRGFLHAAVLPQISEQVVVEGVRYTVDVWKEHLKDLFLPDTWEMRRSLIRDKQTGKLRNAKKATPHRVRKHTEDLGIKRYSQFIDACIAHAASEWGVQFRFRAEDREAARYVAPVRKRAEELEPA